MCEVSFKLTRTRDVLRNRAVGFYLIMDNLTKASIIGYHYEEIELCFGQALLPEIIVTDELWLSFLGLVSIKCVCVCVCVWGGGGLFPVWIIGKVFD